MKIWMFNHYATNMFYEGAGRHQGLAKYLAKQGHDITIFCADTIHGRDECVEISEDKIFLEKNGPDEIKYVFIKTVPYAGNGMSRIKNMSKFYSNIIKVCKGISKNEGPDVILASSVHPLTLIAGIKIAKKFDIPCVCEVRDLWPESLVAFNILKRNSIITKIMYIGEKWIYKKADKLIFTMPGGSKYIRDRKWHSSIKDEKIFHINNGVDLEKYEADRTKNCLYDDDLQDSDVYKIIYAGSIRTANKIDDFIHIAEELKRRSKYNIRIIVFGDGDQRERLEQECKLKGLDNIVFKGRVEKKYVPYVLSCGDLNIVTDESNSLGQYGISWNKMFEYMASGKPTIVNYDMGNYNIVEENGFGIAREYSSAEEFCEAVIAMTELSKLEYDVFVENAKAAAKKYDYKMLANDLMEVLTIAIRDYN